MTDSSPGAGYVPGGNQGSNTALMALPDQRASMLPQDGPTPVVFVDGYQCFIAGEMSYFAGVGAAGKTTLMVQLACSVALSPHRYPGAPLWLGRPISIRGEVLFISAEESANDIHRKLMDVCADQGIDLKDLSNLHISDISDFEDKAMLRSAGRRRPLIKTPLFKSFEAKVSRLKPALIIIDNRAQIADVEELDRNQATQVGNIFRRISKRYKATIILLVHPSVSGEKDGRSGSTGFNNVARNVILMRRPAKDGKDADDDGEDDGKRELRAAKANFSPMGHRANLQWAAGVYHCTDRQPRAGSDIGKPQKAERVFLKLFAKYSKRQRILSDISNSSAYAPAIFFADPEREGINFREFEGAMDRLLTNGTLFIEVLKPGTDREKRAIRLATED